MWHTCREQRKQKLIGGRGYTGSDVEAGVDLLLWRFYLATLKWHIPQAVVLADCLQYKMFNKKVLSSETYRMLLIAQLHLICQKIKGILISQFMTPLINVYKCGLVIHFSTIQLFVKIYFPYTVYTPSSSKNVHTGLLIWTDRPKEGVTVTMKPMIFFLIQHIIYM